MTTAAFWIAIAGLVLAVVSLTWQVLTCAYGGARVRVSLARGYIPSPDGQLGDALIMNARNIGRGQAAIVGWGILMPGGKSFVFPNPEPGLVPQLPATLEGQHSLTFLAPEDRLLPGLLEHTGSLATPIRGFVHLGTGKRVESKPLALRKE